MLKARPGCCEETVEMFGGLFPCNKPATHEVSWPLRGEGPYLMCKAHAWHSEKNRGATTIERKTDGT